MMKLGYEAIEETTAPDLGGVVVPFCCLARSWKAEKFFGPVSIALTEKTMPEPQWFACRQYAQIGFVFEANISYSADDQEQVHILTSLTRIVNVGKSVASSATGMLNSGSVSCISL